MSRESDPPSHNRRRLMLFAVAAAVSAAAVLLLWRSKPDPAYWGELFDRARLFAENHPWALMLAIATVPGIGVPLRPLLVAFGVTVGHRHGLPAACALAILAQSACSIWTYFVAAGPLREWLRRPVERYRQLPVLTDRNALRVACLVRVTPGFPYAAQTMTLGVLRIPFKLYLLASLPIQSAYTVAFVVTGGAVFEGRAGLAITGILLLVVIVLATRIWRARKKPHDG